MQWWELKPWWRPWEDRGAKNMEHLEPASVICMQGLAVKLWWYRKVIDTVWVSLEPNKGMLNHWWCAHHLAMPPLLLFLCSFELSFSIRWIALVFHKLPIIMLCFITGPKATQSRDHRLKPTKLGTQINLSSFYVVYFKYFLIAMKSWLNKKATGSTQRQTERGHVECSKQSYRDRLSQILGTHYDIICTECKTWRHEDLGFVETWRIVPWSFDFALVWFFLCWPKFLSFGLGMSILFHDLVSMLLVLIFTADRQNLSQVSE